MWHNQEISLPTAMTRVSFTATKKGDSNQPYGDIALDDIAVYSGSCEEPSELTTLPVTTQGVPLTTQEVPLTTHEAVSSGHTSTESSRSSFRSSTITSSLLTSQATDKDNQGRGGIPGMPNLSCSCTHTVLSMHTPPYQFLTIHFLVIFSSATFMHGSLLYNIKINIISLSTCI